MSRVDRKCLGAWLLVLGLLTGPPCLAQAPPAETRPPAEAAAAAEPPASAEDIESLVKRMQEQVERMNRAAAERDKALKFLEEQVNAATGQLSATGQTADSLRSRAAELSSTVETLAKDRDKLATELESVEDQRERQLRELEQRIAALDTALGSERQDGAGLRQRLAESSAALEASRNRLAALESELGETRKALDASRRDLTVRASEKDKLGAEVTALQAAKAKLEQDLADLARARDAAKVEVGSKEQRIAELERRAREQETALGASRQEAERLKVTLAATASQLADLGTSLQVSESRVAQQEGTIADLAGKLNVALAQKVEELSRYRSEFFGRLRQVLGDQPGVRVVGDRFVLPSELLFASGSPRLDPTGEAQLRELARTLKEITAKIPPDVRWVLRVDGHTDKLPIRTDLSPFRSNWELSAARAISVVEFLIREGIPAQHLAAVGFGEFQPLDTRDDEFAYRRNRRIELKLTEG